MALYDLRIFCCGTGSTGKTTVVNTIGRMLPALEVIPSPNRMVQERMGINEKDQLNLSQKEIFELEVAIMEEWKIISATMASGVVADRSPLDTIAYSLQRCWGEIPDEVFKQWMSDLCLFLGRIDVLVYFPMNDNLDKAAQDDGFRFAGKAAREGHDNIIRGMLSKLTKFNGIKNILEIPMASPEERAISILASGVLRQPKAV